MHDVAKVSELFDTDLWALDFWYLRGSHGVTVGTAVMLRWQRFNAKESYIYFECVTHVGNVPVLSK